MEQIDAEQVMAYVKDLGRILEVGTAEELEDVAHFESVGGAEGIRTPDPLLAKQVLSQLSYSPTPFLFYC